MTFAGSQQKPRISSASAHQAQHPPCIRQCLVKYMSHKPEAAVEFSRTRKRVATSGPAMESDAPQVDSVSCGIAMAHGEPMRSDYHVLEFVNR
eukprot:6214110-Pleurochrysis_carterae.AAC.5